MLLYTVNVRDTQFVSQGWDKRKIDTLKEYLTV
jgi:hypothetical protein